MGALLDALPPGGSASSDIARERMLLDYVQRGFVDWSWQDVSWTEGGHTIVFRAMTDGMKVEGTRIDASATLSQLIADKIGAILPTAKMCDIIWQKAPVKFAPLTRQITSTTAAMIDQSHRIDVAIGESTGLVGNVGKYWVLTNKLLVDSPGCGGGSFPPVQVPDVAANYGWYVSSGSSPAASAGLHVIQPVSRCHDRLHTDYSQLCQLVATQAILDGQPVDIRALLTSTQMAPLLSTEGVLETVRQPGVENGWGSAGGGPIASGHVTPTPGGPATPAAPTAPTASTGGGFGTTMLYAFAGGLATAVAFKIVQG